MAITYLNNHLVYFANVYLLYWGIACYFTQDSTISSSNNQNLTEEKEQGKEQLIPYIHYTECYPNGLIYSKKRLLLVVWNTPFSWFKTNLKCLTPPVWFFLLSSIDALLYLKCKLNNQIHKKTAHKLILMMDTSTIWVYKSIWTFLHKFFWQTLTLHTLQTSKYNN